MPSRSMSLLAALVALGAAASCRLTESVDDFTSGASANAGGSGGAGGIDGGNDASLGDAKSDALGDATADGNVGGSSGDGAAGSGGQDGGKDAGDGGAADASDANDASTDPCSSGLCSATCKDCDSNSSNGCETNIDESKFHCGGCGHSCYGAACVGGACQPRGIAMGLALPMGIAVDESRAYFAAGNAVMSVSVASQEQPDTLADSQPSPLYVAVDATHVFWANYTSGGSIATIKKDKTGISTLTSASGPAGLVLTSTNVIYSTSGSDKAIWQVSKSGGSAKAIVSPDSSLSPRGLVLDSTGVFWADNAKGAIMFKPTTGSVKTLVPGQKTPYAIVADSEYIYWTTLGTYAGGDCQESDGTVMKAKKTDGSGLSSIATNLACPQSLVLVGSRLYWASTGTVHANYDNNGVIMTALTSGGTAKTIATGQTKPWSLAANSTFLVWTNHGVFTGEGSVYRLPLL